jgi:hypothetical protein
MSRRPGHELLARTLAPTPVLVRLPPRLAPSRGAGGDHRARPRRRHAAGRRSGVRVQIRGSTAPREIVILGAHLDSWDLGRGALDNG